MTLKPTDDPCVFIDENGNEVFSSPGHHEWDIYLFIIACFLGFFAPAIGFYVSHLLGANI